jgi:hypothetical protein
VRLKERIERVGVTDIALILGVPAVFIVVFIFLRENLSENLRVYESMNPLLESYGYNGIRRFPTSI